jgi:hypothetical protein
MAATTPTGFRNKINYHNMFYHYNTLDRHTERSNRLQGFSQVKQPEIS